MAKCKICKKRKETFELDEQHICIDCYADIIEREKEYYSRISKDELISMYKSTLKDLKEKDNHFSLFLLGIIAACLFISYIDSPNMCSNMNLFEAILEIFNQIFVAIGFCLLAGAAWVILLFLYYLITTHIKSKTLKVISTILLILIVIFAYASFLIS